MREQLKVRFADKDDHAQVIEWINRNQSFDPGILKYPTLQLICAHNGKPISFLPVHRGLILESLASNPWATELEKAEALKDLTKAAELLASSYGIKELYFMVSDKDVQKIAENHGFETVTVCRMKL